MEIMRYGDMNRLREPKLEKNEPSCDRMNTYDISRMIAKRTKFRTTDVLEVINAFCDVAAMCIVERKTIDLKWFKIYMKWERNRNPIYRRKKDREYWSYGQFRPIVTFVPKMLALFCGHKRLDSDILYRAIIPYLEIRDGNGDIDEYLEKIKDKYELTQQLGRNYIIDEDGYLIYEKGDRRTKHRYFDENFHPTYIEKVHFTRAKKLLIADYWRIKKAGGDPGSFRRYVMGGLVLRGYIPVPEKFQEEFLESIRIEEEEYQKRMAEIAYGNTDIVG